MKKVDYRKIDSDNNSRKKLLVSVLRLVLLEMR